MSNFKLRILIIFFVIISIFPAYKLIEAKTLGKEESSSEINNSGGQDVDTSIPDTSIDDTSIGEPETTPEEAKEESSNPVDIDKTIEEVKTESSKNSTILNILKIVDAVINKTYSGKNELTLGEIAAKILPISSQKSDLEKKLDAFVIKKLVVKKITKGLRIKGVVVVNKHMLNACIEIGKKDGVWYSIFYIKSPSKWKFLEYFPELLDINKLFPKLNKTILGKYAKSEFFEFSVSYFYISTIAMDEYKNFGKIVKGTGFNGKVRFIGEFDFINKIFGLGGEFLEIYGNIDSKLAGSEFKIKIPKATIIPEVLKVTGKPDIKLIDGFKVDLESSEFYIKFVKKDAPEFKAKSWVIVKLPYEETPIEFNSNIEFEDKKLKLSGSQNTKMSKLFGLEGFSAQDCKIDIIWDFGTKNILPKSLKIEGELQSGKSKLKLEKFEVSTNEDKKINLVVLAKGSLYAKDFANFWLNSIIKDPKITLAVKPLIPEILLEDVILDINWTEKEDERKVELRVNKTDVKLGELVKGLIPASVKDLEKDLNLYSLNKFVANYYKSGLRIKSTININSKPLNIAFEVAKEDGKWYSLFYFKTPEKEKWKLSDYFPDLLTVKKLFPSLDKNVLSKLSSQDMFEFEDMTFYISSADIKSHEKLGKLNKGVGYRGKAKFIGALEFFDKIIGLDGKPVEISGDITTKLADTDFTIKIPAKKTVTTIAPETIKKDSSELSSIIAQDVKFIPGFKVDLMDQAYSIKFVKGIPEFSGKGGVKVTVPYEKEPLEFLGKVSFEEKVIKFSGKQKAKISKLFDVEGLIVDDCKANISWDLSSANILPKALGIEGKIKSGKSKLKFDLDFSLDDKNKVNLGINAKGALFVKDFADFWLNVIIKDPKIAIAVKPLIPDITFADVVLKANLADKQEDRKFKLEVNKADIKLGEIARVLIPTKDGQKSDIEKYMDKFAITKASAEYYKEGLKIEGSTLINKNPLDLLIEICKDTDKKVWYSLFYLKSPDKWKASDYLPDYLNAKTLFPKLDPKILAQLSSPDVFEFSQSYFYISTIEIKKHEKVGHIVQGAGFNGKAKFIGVLDILNKIFVLNEPLQVSGSLKVPKVFGSKFSIKIPTNMTIIPQKIIVNKKEQDLIKGFQVDLSGYEFGIKLIEEIPYVQFDATGGINVTVPFIKEKLDFFSEVKFSGKQMSLSGGQRKKLENIFDVQGLGLDGCKIGLNWDFGVSGQWAGALAPVTFGVGAIAVALPTGFIIEGGLSSQKPGSDKKCNLNIKTDFSLNSTSAIDLKYESKGTLFVKDFAQFWLDVIVKSPNKQRDDKFKKDFMAKVPDFIFEDVNIKGAWAKDADKELILSAGKIELIKDVPAKINLKVSTDRISGSGSILVPVYLPDKKNPVFTIKKSMDNDTEGPSFTVNCTISPVKIDFKSDAAIIAKFSGALGDVKSATHIDFSDEGIFIDTKTDALGIESNLKINGKLGSPINIDDWAISGGFDKKSRDKLAEFLKTTQSDVSKVTNDLTKVKESLIAKNNAVQEKVVKEIDVAKKRVDSDINAYFSNGKLVAYFAEETISSEIAKWENLCNAKPWYEKPWCDLFQVVTRKVALQAVKIYRNIGADIISAFARKSVNAISEAGKVFASLDPKDIKKSFELLGTGITAEFTDLFVEVSKLIDEMGKNTIEIYSLKFDAKMSDIKKGLLPTVVYDAKIMNRRPDKPVELKLDLKNPGEFIKTISTQMSKDALSGIYAKINKEEADLSKKIEQEEKAQEQKIAAKEKEAKDKAGIK